MNSTAIAKSQRTSQKKVRLPLTVDGQSVNQTLYKTSFTQPFGIYLSRVRQNFVRIINYILLAIKA